MQSEELSWGEQPGPGQRQGRAGPQGRTLETQSNHWAAMQKLGTLQLRY